MSNKYLKFVDTALAVSGKSHLPIYSCKYSKRTYTQHQLLTLILLKEYLNKDYRSIVELVELMDKLKLKIGLKQVPHFTTLHKFTTRINSVIFRSLLQQTLKIGSVEMLLKSLSFSLIPQIQPMYRSTFENIQGIENCMINEDFYRGHILLSAYMLKPTRFMKKERL